jgi:hypothetical protein
MIDPKIDSAIDRAVRDLMDVDADAAFRARVTARLQQTPGRRWSLAWLALPATAAALIVGLIWGRSAPVRPVPPGPVARIEAPAASSPPEGATLSSSAESPDTPPPPRRRTAAGTAVLPIAPRAIVAAAVGAPSSIGPLAALESIRIETIAQTPIAPAAIDLVPLTAIAEIQLAPLEPRTARH